MARITPAEAQGWVDSTKLPITSLDAELVDALEIEILAKLAPLFDTSTWIDVASTPYTIRVVIAKTYASWIYDRFYSENQDELNDYAQRLIENAKMMMQGILDGVIEVIDDDGTIIDPTNPPVPSFYPTNASSSQQPTTENPSLGGPYMSMGRRF